MLITGLITLLVSGNYLVKGGVELAKTFKLSKLVIGVTIVSFGTSAPELLVSLSAAIDGKPDISIGNVLGSNISNIALVLALTATILPIPVHRNTIRIDWPFMMLSTIVLYLFFINDFGLFPTENAVLQRWEGAVLFSMLIAFIFYSIRKSRKNRELEKIEKPSMNIWLAIGLVLVSCLGLIYGAKWLIKGASDIAASFGISDRVISLTVVAFGTSVPELATSVIAAFKKEMDISVGNIVGSNIFNILAILGITSMVTPIKINPQIIISDIYWVIGISLLLFLAMLPIKKPVIKRYKGFIMLLAYVIYTYVVISMKEI